jgi:hypothetical protein
MVYAIGITLQFLMIISMKKLLYLSIALLFAACTKNNDFEKNGLEKALPIVEVTSLGLVTQTGPFTTASVIQITFGGALTHADPGVFDYAFYDGSTRVDSVHFPSWNEKASTATANQAITTTMIPTSYANTSSFSGNLVLKLSKLTAGKSYTLKVYASTANNEVASFSVSKLVTIN